MFIDFLNINLFIFKETPLTPHSFQILRSNLDTFWHDK